MAAGTVPSLGHRALGSQLMTKPLQQQTLAVCMRSLMAAVASLIWIVRIQNMPKQQRRLSRMALALTKVTLTRLVLKPRRTPSSVTLLSRRMPKPLHQQTPPGAVAKGAPAATTAASMLVLAAPITCRVASELTRACALVLAVGMAAGTVPSLWHRAL